MLDMAGLAQKGGAVLGHIRLSCPETPPTAPRIANGGAGFLDDSAVSRLFRDAKPMEIGAGTSEIRHMLIGREVMAQVE